MHVSPAHGHQHNVADSAGAAGLSITLKTLFEMGLYPGELSLRLELLHDGLFCVISQLEWQSNPCTLET